MQAMKPKTDKAPKLSEKISLSRPYYTRLDTARVRFIRYF